MDFEDMLNSFAGRIDKLKPQILTEEATKTSLIMPFFQQVLGYDVFNPSEFVPEFTADVGIKKGEKVDYAICHEGNPVILIEAKWCGMRLDKHGSQLFRYFSTTSAKFGILTNGIIYRFFTDLDEANKMDTKPFLEVDLLNIKPHHMRELKRFHKSYFNIDEIFSTASELKYSSEIKQYFARQLESPSDDFVRFIVKNIYDGVKTQAVIEKFIPIVKDAINGYVSELMNEKITSALKPREEKADETNEEPAVSENTDSGTANAEMQVATTEEELEAFYIIKSILANYLPHDRISYKKTTRYFAVLYENNVRKTICRLFFDGRNKRIAFVGDDKKEERYPLEDINDIYNMTENLSVAVEKYKVDITRFLYR